MNIKNKDQECFAYSILAAMTTLSTHNKQEPKP